MKGFGFPGSGINGSNAPYRADTSQKKIRAHQCTHSILKVVELRRKTRIKFGSTQKSYHPSRFYSRQRSNRISKNNLF